MIFLLEKLIINYEEITAIDYPLLKIWVKIWVKI